MKNLDVQDLFEYGRAAVAVLRTLEVKNATMSYADFARSIGILGRTATWAPWHRQQTQSVLNIVAAVEKAAGHKGPALQYARVINQRTGQPGKGVAKTSKIVTE